MGVSSNLVVVNIKDAGGTFRSIRCRTNNVVYDSSASVSEEKTMCATEKTVGSPSKGLTFDGLLDDGTVVADDIFDLLYDLQESRERTEFQYGPRGDDSGEVLISGYGIVSKLTLTHSEGNSVAISGELAIDGNDVKDVWP